MDLRLRLGFFWVVLFECILLMTCDFCLQAADSAPLDGTHQAGEGTSPPPVLSFQEQQDLIQQAIELARRDTQLAAHQAADATAARLAAIEQLLTQQHQTELEAFASSNRTTLIMASALAAAGLLGIFCLAFFLMRATNRLTEMTMAVTPFGHTPGPGRLANSLAGENPPVGALNAVEAGGARFLGEIEQLEKRLIELEQTTQHAPVTNAEHGFNGLPKVAAAETKSDEDVANAALFPPVLKAVKPSPAVAAAGTGQGSQIALLLGKAHTLMNLDRSQEALACVEEVIAIDPGNAEAFVKKGAILENLLRMDEAIESYDRAIAADDSMITAYLHKGGILNRLQRYGEALECYEKSLRGGSKPGA